MVEETVQEIRAKVSKIKGGFGLAMRLLEEVDLPLICYWRNHPMVLHFMYDKRMVTIDILRFWFRRITISNTALYYMVFQQDVPVGFFGLNHIDWANRTYEEEIVLDPGHIGNRLGYRVFMLRERISQMLGLETTFNYINVDNLRSISMAKRLSYEFIKTKNNFHVYRAECARLRKALRAVAKASGMEEEFIRYFGVDAR